MKKIIAIIFVLHSFSSKSGNEISWAGSRAASMGYTAVATSDFWSVVNNQAGMAFFENQALGLFTENRFMLKELNKSTIAYTNPFFTGSLGINLTYFGYNMYNEKKAGIAYAKKLSERFALGIQLDYFHTSLGDIYGSKSAVTFEIGFLSKLNNQLSIGGHVFNPVQANFNDHNNEKIPSTLTFGFSYLISENIITTFETEKSIELPINLKIGTEFKINEFSFARLGINTNPTLLTFGYGISYNNFIFDFSSNYHQLLGFSPQLSVIYLFK